uniref:Uncharacterized protein n=1 Tax=Anopheles minimus TaxID=112268 RepID=A0A182WGV2_9DIPT
MKLSPQLVTKKLASLASIPQIQLQLEEIRKILSHFIDPLQTSTKYDECYAETLNICENLIAKCDVTDRDTTVLLKILNTILEVVRRDHVSKRAVIASLAVIHLIMGNLYHLEVIHLHTILQEKLPYVCKYFNKMEHFGIMWSIVGIVYEFVGKYEYDQRAAVLTDILKGFDDATGQLADMLLWPPELFNTECRKFLNNIPGRKYYSLSARSAILGGRLILPRRGFEFISFNWNTNPLELSFNTFCFATEMHNVSEVNVDLKDITTMHIIEDPHEPRVICEYENKTEEGVPGYQLKINVLDNAELSELAMFITPLIKSVQYVQLSKPPASDNMSQENIIRHEKLYDNTVQLVDEINSDKQPTEPEETVHPMAVDEGRDEESIDADADSTFQPFDMQWKLNLIANSTKNKQLPKDPYDLAHMREEENEQRKEKASIGGMAKRGSQKKYTSAASGQRPRNINFSTPKKLRGSNVPTNFTIVNDEVSSIDGNSHDELLDSEGSDHTWEPYVMLSKTTTRGHSNPRGKKRLNNPSARVPAKRMSVKNNESSKKKPGTGRRTGPKTGKEQHYDDWSGTASAESSMQLNVAKKDRPCYKPNTTPPRTRGTYTRGRNNQQGTNYRCERLNSINTTTKMTTKVTTTKTTGVGIGSCTETGNSPTADTATQADASMTSSRENIPGPGTQQQVYTHTVEKRQEYCVRVQTNSICNTLTEGKRVEIRDLLYKMLEIVSPGSLVHSDC